MLQVSEFNTLYSKNVRKAFDDGTKDAIRNSSMNKIFQIEDTGEYTEYFTTMEGNNLPTYINEWEALPTVDFGKGYRSVFSSKEFGHKIAVTYQARLKTKDSDEMLLKYVNNLKNKAIVALYTFLEKETHKMLNDAFAGASLVAPDLNPICYATHTWNSTWTTFSNVMSSSALDISVVDEAVRVWGAFVDSNGNPMPLDFKTIIVKKGGKAHTLAKKIFGFTADKQFRPTTIGAIDIYEGEYTIIATPYLTSNTAYFFLADWAALGIENPLFVNFIERPTLQTDFTSPDNLNWTASYAGSFKFGCRDMPFVILWSPGA